MVASRVRGYFPARQFSSAVCSHPPLAPLGVPSEVAKRKVFRIISIQNKGLKPACFHIVTKNAGGGCSQLHDWHASTVPLKAARQAEEHTRAGLLTHERL